MRFVTSLVLLSFALVVASCSSGRPAGDASDGGLTGSAEGGVLDAGVDGDAAGGLGPGGGGDAEPAGDGGVARAAADFEIAFAKLNCQFQARCGFLAASEEAACEAAVDAARGAPLPYASEAALAAGRLTFQADTAVRCLDLTRTKGCFDQRAPSVTCGAVYTASV